MTIDELFSAIVNNGALKKSVKASEGTVCSPEGLTSVSAYSIEWPYRRVIKKLQDLRKEHPKGSISNLMYKEMANSVYGNVVRGVSNKKVFDIKTGAMLRLDVNELSNPIYGCYITALVRSVIGETLWNIGKLGGKVVSVTTDGFITDVKDLEDQLMGLDAESTLLLRLYRELRASLGFDRVGYELKSSGRGVIS